MDGAGGVHGDLVVVQDVLVTGQGPMRDLGKGIGRLSGCMLNKRAGVGEGVAAPRLSVSPFSSSSPPDDPRQPHPHPLPHPLDSRRR